MSGSPGAGEAGQHLTDGGGGLGDRLLGAGCSTRSRVVPAEPGPPRRRSPPTRCPGVRRGAARSTWRARRQPGSRRRPGRARPTASATSIRPVRPVVGVEGEHLLLDRPRPTDQFEGDLVDGVAAGGDRAADDTFAESPTALDDHLGPVACNRVESEHHSGRPGRDHLLDADADAVIGRLVVRPRAVGQHGGPNMPAQHGVRWSGRRRYRRPTGRCRTDPRSWRRPGPRTHRSSARRPAGPTRPNFCREVGVGSDGRPPRDRWQLGRGDGRGDLGAESLDGREIGVTRLTAYVSDVVLESGVREESAVCGGRDPNPGGTWNPAAVISARLANLPPRVGLPDARGSSIHRTSDVFMRPHPR